MRSHDAAHRIGARIGTNEEPFALQAQQGLAQRCSRHLQSLREATFDQHLAAREFALQDQPPHDGIGAVGEVGGFVGADIRGCRGRHFRCHSAPLWWLRRRAIDALQGRP